MNLPKLSFVTFTGADDTTRRSDLERLINRAYELGVNIEIACLMGKSLEGSPRYPRPDKVYELLRHVYSWGVHSVALHVCEQAAVDLLVGEVDSVLWGDWLQPLGYATVVGRVQINAPAELVTPESLNRARNALYEKYWAHPQVIGQSRTLQYPRRAADDGAPSVGLAHFPSDVRPKEFLPEVSYLYDRSGGTGVAPSSWPELEVGRLVGLAGGLGAGTAALESVLAHIDAAPAGSTCWIDMESSLRGERDEFSTEMCAAVLEHDLLRKLSRA